MADQIPYKLVRLANGAHSVHSTAHGETMHPGLGPQAEASALYVEQLGLIERLRGSKEDFVIWDVGLGAGANVLTVLRATRECGTPLRIASFDQSLEPIRFAFEQREKLGFFEGYDQAITRLLSASEATFRNGQQSTQWTWTVCDFPALLRGSVAGLSPKPHAILFDPWSPTKNPAMWTAALFSDLFKHLDPTRPCALATYSRSTMMRVSLLLAGFHVGVGNPTGSKEETTIAANSSHLVTRPLDQRWLERAARSDCAEPLWGPVYRRLPLAASTLDSLRQHPQFQ